MDISIEVSERAATALHDLSPNNTESDELLKAASHLGVTLQPMHPDTDDNFLIKSFFVEVSTENEADRVVDALLECKAVEGAYAKPDAGLP